MIKIACFGESKRDIIKALAKSPICIMNDIKYNEQCRQENCERCIEENIEWNIIDEE